MKTTHIFFAVLLLSTRLLIAQSTFKLDPKTSTFIDKAQMEFIYKYTINAPLKDSVNTTKLETYTTILQTNAITSKFWDWHAFKKDSIIYFSSENLSIDSIDKLEWKYYFEVRNLFIPVIVKNYPNGKITVTDEITPNDYIYTENKTEHKWELKDDTLTVCGYLCNKAVVRFGGREWTAWYAPEITLSDGPWKLCGLPGLILKAEDNSGTHNFEAITIRNSNRPIYLAKSITRIKTTKEVFIKTKNKFEEDPEKNLVAPANVSTISIFKEYGKILFDDKCYSIKIDTKYCPLEY